MDEAAPSTRWDGHGGGTARYSLIRYAEGGPATTPMHQPIAILCGGPSVEHDVSLASAARIEAALKSRGDVILVTVDRSGERWAIADAGDGTSSDATKSKTIQSP